MAKRTRFSEYQSRYANYRFELTDDGILFMQCHTDGDSLVWELAGPRRHVAMRSPMSPVTARSRS